MQIYIFEYYKVINIININIKKKFSEGKKEKIITKKQLVSVMQCINYLKQNVHYNGIFINYGSQIQVKKIVAKIRRGDVTLWEFLQYSCTPRECASALNNFLNKIGHPLLPIRIQQLLIADNLGVNTKTIALDALGLLYQDVKGPHLQLVISLLDLMKELSTRGSLRPTEVRVSHAPYLLMPLFFHTSDAIITNWRNIADVLNEMIMFSHLLINDNVSDFSIQDRLVLIYHERNLSIHRSNVQATSPRPGINNLDITTNHLRRPMCRSRLHSLLAPPVNLTYNPPYIRGIS